MINKRQQWALCLYMQPFARQSTKKDRRIDLYTHIPKILQKAIFSILKDLGYTLFVTIEKIRLPCFEYCPISLDVFLV